MSYDDDQDLGARMPDAGGVLDLDALGDWQPQAPPPGFADAVMDRVLAGGATGAFPAEPERGREANVTSLAGGARRRRVGVTAAGVSVLALAAAALVRVTSLPPASGEAIAKERVEVSLGTRARAVLELGAHVSWRGDDVVQDRGDVFYRVEPGARFQVHTPAGDVEVKGTCFTVKVREGGAPEDAGMQKRDVKAGAIGAALSAMAFVAVHEGKVAVSHAGERVELAAGEGAELGAGGLARASDLAHAQKHFDEKAAEQAAGSLDPLSQANANLVAQVQDYRQRLEAITQQKGEVERKLGESERKLAQSDAGALAAKNEFELSKDDWAELAKNGAIKYRTPCLRPDGWTPSAEQLNRLGLAPGDATVIRDASQKTYARVWSVVKSLCTQALGVSEKVAESVGVEACTQVVYETAMHSDEDAAREAHTQVAEIRAGQRREPGPGDKAHPVLRLMLALTAANDDFESELAKSLGPEEAHRLAYSNKNDMCTSNHRWGGGKKRGGDGSK